MSSRAAPKAAQQPEPPSSSDPQRGLGAAVSDAELQRYVRTSLWRALLVLVVLLGALAVAGRVWQAELLATVSWVWREVGLVGLCAILFASDSVVTPFPPDALLVVVSKSEVRAWWAPIVLLFSVVSALAGNAGWWFGKHLGRTRWPQVYLQRFGQLPAALVERYGRRAVAIGALTPVPFSVTCWLAGMLGMPLARFWPMTLLRIPRFFLYYLLIFWV